jgi:UDP-glucose 4-epimerase
LSGVLKRAPKEENMTVLITGGLGAIGSSVARNLVEMGIEPVLYDAFEDNTLINDIKDKTLYVAGDVLDLPHLVETIKKYRVKRMIHTVALLSKADPKKSIRINTQGTVNALWAAEQCKIERFVYTSSKAVYSEISGIHSHPRYRPINEDYPKDDPMGIYGVTKFFGEQIGMQFHKNFGIDFVALRFSTTFGPGRLLKNPNSPMVIPCRIIENAMLGKPFTFPKGGGQKDDYIYNRDVGRGVALACFKKDLTHRVFNIGTGIGSTLIDFAQATRKIFPAFEFEIGPGPDHAGIGFDFYSVYDVSRTKNELGFTPQYNIEEAVRDYIETMQRLNIEPTFVR